MMRSGYDFLKTKEAGFKMLEESERDVPTQTLVSTNVAARKQNI